MRMNDVDGMEGFGRVEVDEGEHAPFSADWEARVFAIASALLAQGHWELDEFRDAIERMPPADYLAASYYERWLHAVRTLLAEKGLVEPAALRDLAHG
jgi:nitrile hydratase subunit beta